MMTDEQRDYAGVPRHTPEQKKRFDAARKRKPAKPKPPPRDENGKEIFVQSMLKRLDEE